MASQTRLLKFYLGVTMVTPFILVCRHDYYFIKTP